MKICISSGHGTKIRGASGYLDEVDEAIRVMDQVAEFMTAGGVEVMTFTDTVSTSQNANLNAIVNWHNSQTRDLDISVHFNAYQTTQNPMGTEVLYVTQSSLAAKVSAAIAEAGGFINRGAKYRSDLYFLNSTEKPAILLEVCFVDSSTDSHKYQDNFEVICEAIANLVPGVETEPDDDKPTVPAETAQQDIICTVFAGSSDPQQSAYDGHWISDSELGVALPWKWRDGPPPKVRVYNRSVGAAAVGQVLDVGPWLTDDPYWNYGERPLAETCYLEDTPLPRGPNAGVVPNGAGIDITPALAKAIGLSGKGEVDWEFAE